MKKILILSILLFSTNSFAQEQNSLVSVLNQLKDLQFYKDCKKFKTQIETQTKVAGKIKISQQQFQSLEASYTSTWIKYDAFLKILKQDLIDKQHIQKLASNAESESQYLSLLNETKTEYETSFLPIYQDIMGGKDIPEEVLKIGIDLVKKLIVKIKERKQNKNEIINNILPIVNTLFYNELKLKTFSELDLQFDENQKPENKEEITIPAPTLNGLEGNIEFIQIVEGIESTMDFELNLGKDIVINQETGLSYKSPYYTSIDTYSKGTNFKIKAISTAFIYAIVLNSDGIKLLHPNIQYSQNGKNIEVKVNTSPTNGEITLPINGFFTIVDSNDGSSSDSEDFALIISKSELNMEDTIEKINSAPGKLDERFSQVFSNQQITYEEAKVESLNRRIQFEYFQDKNILPLTFKILR